MTYTVIYISCMRYIDVNKIYPSKKIFVFFSCWQYYASFILISFVSFYSALIIWLLLQLTVFPFCMYHFILSFIILIMHQITTLFFKKLYWKLLKAKEKNYFWKSLKRKQFIKFLQLENAHFRCGTLIILIS